MPKSNQDKERVPQRYIVRKDTVPGKQECNKEMDAEIPQLGPGTGPADCPVRGTAHTTPVKNRDGSDQRHCHPRLTPSAFILLPEIPALFQRPGVGSSHENGNNIQCLFAIQKNV